MKGKGKVAIEDKAVPPGLLSQLITKVQGSHTEWLYQPHLTR